MRYPPNQGSWTYAVFSSVRLGTRGLSGDPSEIRQNARPASTSSLPQGVPEILREALTKRNHGQARAQSVRTPLPRHSACGKHPRETLKQLQHAPCLPASALAEAHCLPYFAELVPCMSCAPSASAIHRHHTTLRPTAITGTSEGTAAPAHPRQAEKHTWAGPAQAEGPPSHHTCIPSPM